MGLRYCANCEHLATAHRRDQSGGQIRRTQCGKCACVSYKPPLKILRVCPNCSVEFMPPKFRQVICSSKCRDEQNSKRHPAIEKDFWLRVKKSDGCWLWSRGGTASGYGTITRNRKTVYTHRLSWEIHYGPIPDGLWVLHHCDNPPCVRPDHLFLGTHIDNMRDCVAKGRHLTSRPRVRGENAGGAKLTKAKVLSIRQNYKKGTTTRLQLSQRYGVSRSTIDRILMRQVWKHI